MRKVLRESWVVVLLAAWFVLVFAGCATVRPQTQDERMLASQLETAEYRGWKLVIGTPEQVDWLCRKLEPRWTNQVHDCAFPGKKWLVVPRGTPQAPVDAYLDSLRGRQI